MAQTLCLNMIVKDEAHIIRDTLTHLLTIFPITYWVIDDTGSTDGTQDLIRGFFGERGIPGELHESPWRNFGYNRSQAFAHAHGKSDYVIVWDADDSVVGTLHLPSPLTADSYPIQFGNDSGFRYQRPQIFNNRKKWHYVGVLHEYAACLDANVQHGPLVTGDYYCVSGKSGSRSKDPQKYRKDAAVLEQGLLDEPDNARYAFYCANSYKDANDQANAIRMYKRVLTMNGWAEEKYLACLRIFDLSGGSENLHYLVESHKHCPERVEGILRLVRHYTVAGMNNVALAYYSLVQNFFENRYDPAKVATHLFAAKADYDYFLPYHTIISAIREARFDLAFRLYDHIFRHKHTSAGAWWNNCLFHNLALVAPHLTPNLNFLDRLLAFRAALPYKLDDAPNKAIAAVIDRHRDLLGAPPDGPPHLMIQDRRTPRVLLTITSCKRLDLFRKTVNSLLHTWTDLDAVDSFFCVDDNSSEEDRAAMRAEFPFFEFHWKTPAERGHRESMNIIWQLLQERKPTYWVHLEDDWLFFRRGSYVREPIEILDRSPAQAAGIQQLLYNRNYAELYSDGWGINGGTQLEPGVLLHQKDAAVAGRNCAYWPHYSFRPSVVRVAPVLALGNFDSANTFFERDYADRWFAAGHRSAFYDDIRCLHIGRLTSDRSTGANAYTLNGTGQFTEQKRSVFVVNLARRPDRRDTLRNTFATVGWSDASGDYSFLEAVDGQTLVATPEIVHLFAGNDFGSRRGFIGCALSHYRLWQKVAAWPVGSRAIVFEDDIEIPDPATFAARLANVEARVRDLLFLGHTCWSEADRFRSTDGGFEPFEPSRYVGGTFGYIITPTGARRYLEYIQANGICHGIDYLLKKIPAMQCDVATPHIVTSEWVRTADSIHDSDIQRDHDSLDLSGGDWIFYPRLDHIGDDKAAVGRKSVAELIALAEVTPGCRAFNTMGFLKKDVKFPLVSSRWFNTRDGVFVRKPRIELLGFWGNPSALRAEFEDQFAATTTEVALARNGETADFSVVLGKPLQGTVVNPARTLTFHLEPWCGEPWQTWGVKTWGEWAAPDPARFLHVQTAACEPTPGFWQLRKTPTEEVTSPKVDLVACILSAKKTDPGQIHRVEFLHYLEKTHPDLHVAVFGSENYHNLAAYSGPVTGGKEDILLPIKYYFMCENNAEKNYVTEKLWDPILCETLCFYWGAPNIAEIVDPAAYIQLDMTDYGAAARTIREAIAADEWARRLPAIRAAKRKLLKEQALFAVIERVLREKGALRP